MHLVLCHKPSFDILFRFILQLYIRWKCWIFDLGYCILFFTLLFLYFLIQVTCVICYVRFLAWFHIPYFVYELPILFIKVLCMLSRYASSLLHLLVFVYMYALFLIFSWLFHFVLPFSYIIYFFYSWFEWNVCCICYGTLVMIC